MTLPDAIHTGYPFKRECWKSDGFNTWLTVNKDGLNFMAKTNPSVIIDIAPKDIIAVDWIVDYPEGKEPRLYNKGYINVDLDGTLAEYHGEQNIFEIGKPIPEMIHRVKYWLFAGIPVKIFTARVDGGEIARATGVAPEICAYYNDVKAITEMIQDWTEKHIGERLDVTNKKDFNTIEIWDDRAKQVEFNTGKLVDAYGKKFST